MLRSIDEGGNVGDTSVVRNEDHNPPGRRHQKENMPLYSKASEPLQRGGLQRSHAQSGRRAYDPFRDMTMDEIEKLSKPQVKRLKDVAHLCT